MRAAAFGAVDRLGYWLANASAIAALFAPSLWLIGEHVYRHQPGRYYLDSSIGMVVILLVWRRRWRRARIDEPAQPFGELELAQQEWDIWATRARCTPPIVKRTWETDTGHGYYLWVTHPGAIDRDNRPMSVTAFRNMAAYWRDIIGEVCTHVHIEPDPRHGGHAICYVNIRARQQKYREIVTFGGRSIECHTPEEYTAALEEQAEHEQAEALIAEVAQHPRADVNVVALARDDLEAAWAELHRRDAEHDASKRASAVQEPCDSRAEAPSEGAYSLPTATPTPERGAGPRLAPPTGLPRAITWEEPTLEPEGEEWCADYPPGLAAQEVAVFDHIRSGPKGRKSIAEVAGLDDTATSRMLRRWLDAGHVTKVAGLWIASDEYRDRVNITHDGDEEGPEGATADC